MLSVPFHIYPCRGLLGVRNRGKCGRGPHDFRFVETFSANCKRRELQRLGKHGVGELKITMRSDFRFKYN